MKEEAEEEEEVGEEKLQMEEGEEISTRRSRQASASEDKNAQNCWKA